MALRDEMYKLVTRIKEAVLDPKYKAEPGGERNHWPIIDAMADEFNLWEDDLDPIGKKWTPDWLSELVIAELENNGER